MEGSRLSGIRAAPSRLLSCGSKLPPPAVAVAAAATAARMLELRTCASTSSRCAAASPCAFAPHFPVRLPSRPLDPTPQIQARYTSEDNASFLDLVEKDNERKQQRALVQYAEASQQGILQQRAQLMLEVCAGVRGSSS